MDFTVALKKGVDMSTIFVHRVCVGIVMVVIAAATSIAQTGKPLDLTEWTSVDYRVTRDPPSIWTVGADGMSVLQKSNSFPSVFYGAVLAKESIKEATILVEDRDDDFVGFVLGFHPGDTNSPYAYFLLIDWKGKDQWFDFGCGEATFARAGLAVSRVYGVPTGCEFWGHINTDTSDSNLDNGVEELQRGFTLGRKGWQSGQQYFFRFELEQNRLRVSVDGNHEIDIAGNFGGGWFGFYGFSQSEATYRIFAGDPKVSE
jgi:hypothetical protein